MRRVTRIILFALPAITLIVGFCLPFVDPEVFFAPAPLWIWTAIWAITCWTLAVINSFVFIKGRAWACRPFGIIAVTCTVGTGFVAFYLGSVALFCVLLGLTFAISLETVRVSFSGTRPHAVFCGVYAGCIWIGIAWTLYSGAPFTGTPLVQVMWWEMTGWGNGFRWEYGFRWLGASVLGVGYLVNTWVIAFTAAWIANLYAGGVE
jgi:hypothetical protein